MKPPDYRRAWLILYIGGFIEGLIIGGLLGFSFSNRRLPDMPAHWLRLELLLPYAIGAALVLAGFVTRSPDKIRVSDGAHGGVPMNLPSLRLRIRIVAILSFCIGGGLIIFALGRNYGFF
jgi:hypothetical protein